MPRSISSGTRWSRLHRVAILLVVLAVLGLGACESQSTVPHTATPVQLPPSPTKPLPPADWPYRWLEGIPCRPPCWEGITPGQTTAEEAVEILRRSPIVATAEITTIPLHSENGVVEWSWAGTGRQGGGADFYARIPPSPIYLVYPSYPVYFKLGDVIQAYGEPSHIIAKAFHRPDKPGVDYDLRILYRPQGFILGVGGPKKLVLSADTLFESLSFFAPDDEGLQAMLKTLGGPSTHPEWMVPWQGMKDYDYYCRDEAGNPCP